MLFSKVGNVYFGPSFNSLGILYLPGPTKLYSYGLSYFPAI